MQRVYLPAHAPIVRPFFHSRRHFVGRICARFESGLCRSIIRAIIRVAGGISFTVFAHAIRMNQVAAQIQAMVEALTQDAAAYENGNFYARIIPLVVLARIFPPSEGEKGIRNPNSDIVSAVDHPQSKLSPQLHRAERAEDELRPTRNLH